MDAAKTAVMVRMIVPPIGTSSRTLMLYYNHDPSRDRKAAVDDTKIPPLKIAPLRSRFSFEIAPSYFPACVAAGIVMRFDATVGSGWSAWTVKSASNTV